MLKNDIHRSIFGNIDFLPYAACVIVKKGLKTKFPRMEKMGNFFYVIFIPQGNIRQSINFVKHFSSQKIYCTRTRCIKHVNKASHTSQKQLMYIQSRWAVYWYM